MYLILTYKCVIEADLNIHKSFFLIFCLILDNIINIHVKFENCVVNLIFYY